MSAISLLKYAQLALFSTPKGERWIWRHLRRRPAARIVELGVGDCRRASLLIQVAQRYAPRGEVHYTGIDYFESSTSPGQFSIKEAHRRLSGCGGRVRLFPGDPFTALRQLSNALTGTDLLIISATVDDQSLRRAWFYMPRMLTEHSVVAREHAAEGDENHWQRITHGEIADLARLSAPRHAA